VADMPMPVGEAHTDFVALQIAGMGLSKRLLVRVRQQQGLSYGVSSWLQMHPYDDASHWRIYASFAPQNLAKVEAAVADELKVFNDKGLSDTEVQEAVTQWLEGKKQARADDKSLAYLLGDNLDKDRDFSWQASQEEQVKRLTAAQVNRVIATYCQPEKWTRVIAGDWVPPQ
jgi:zinc protease